MKKKLKRGEIVARLGEIAFGRANDAVKLAFIEPDACACEFETLDLSLLSDVKRAASGAVEVKLLNRFEAIKLLLDAVEEPETRAASGAERFFEAINAAAAPEQGDDDC